MKRHLSRISVVAAALSIGFVMAAELPSTADGESGRTGPRDRMPPPGRGTFRVIGEPGIMPLNDWQRRAFEAQLDRGQLRDLEDRMRTAQKELVSAALASPYEEKSVQAKAEAVAGLQAKMTALRAKALSSIASTISPEQKQQLVDSPAGGALLNGQGGGPPVIRMGVPMRGGFGRGSDDFSTGVDPIPRER